MFESIANNYVKEKIKTGVKSQDIHRARADQRAGLSFRLRLVCWIANLRIIKRVASRDGCKPENKQLILRTSEESS